MAYNPKTGIVDIFHGMEDLEHQVIRCVGEPGERFDEDALRILRAIRFSAQLGFSIDPKTEEAMGRKGRRPEKYQRRTDSGGAGEAARFRPSGTDPQGLGAWDYKGHSAGI